MRYTRNLRSGVATSGKRSEIRGSALALVVVNLAARNAAEKNDQMLKKKKKNTQKSKNLTNVQFDGGEATDTKARAKIC